MTAPEEGVPDPARPASVRPGPSPTRTALEFVGVVAGSVLVAAAPNPPATVLQWVQMVGGAVLAAVAGVSAGVALLNAVRAEVRPSPAEADPGAATGPDARPAPRRRLPRLRVWLTPALAVVLVVIAGVAAWRPLTGLWYDVDGCPAATQLRMVANPETIMTAREVAAGYERATARENHGCPTTRIYVFSAPAAAVADELRTKDGWSDDSGAPSETGPRPDLWLAGTGYEVNVLHTGSSAVADAVTVARSPLVLAVPAAGAADPPADGGWSELFRRFTEQGPGVARPLPSSSRLGLLATALLYDSERASVAAGVAPWPPLRPAEIERRLDAARDAADLPIGDTADLLCRRRGQASPDAGGPPPVAIITSEQEVARYNAGLALGGSCGAASRPVDDRRLTALYPQDTGGQDLQLVRTTWSAARQQQAAAAFGAWLQGEGGRAALARTGLRPVGTYPPVEPLTAAFGIDPTRALTEPVVESSVTAAAAAYATTQRPSRLLVAFDTSRSMATLEPGGSRAAIAARAVRAGLEHLGRYDEFGLWLFPGGGGPRPVEAVPVGPRSPDTAAAVEKALREVAPAGGATLFRTVVDGVTTLAPTRLRPAAAAPEGAPDGDPVGVRALLVLTDSEDAASGFSAADAAQQVAGRGVRVVVVTLGEARCAGSGLLDIAEKTGGDCVHTDTSTVGRRVTEIVDELKGGG